MTGEIYNQPVVLDNGSGSIKAGFAGDERPKIHYSNIVGTPKYTKVMPSSISPGDRFIGTKAQNLRGLLRLQYPIRHGTVENWSDMELVWNQVMTDLNCKCEDFPLSITEEPLNPRSNRTKMSEVLFETFNFPSLHISMPAVLSLYSTGRTTGVVVDSGDGITSIVPVCEGFSVPSAMKRIPLGGRDITERLQLELLRSGYPLNSSSEFEIVRSLKERLAFVSKTRPAKVSKSRITEYLMYDASAKTRPFKLPDGKTIQVSESSLTNATELLFEPELAGVEADALPDALYYAIMRTDVDIREKLFESIVLSGGTTLTKGFGGRLLKEMQKLDPERRLKVYASPERKTSCFVGGSILASLSTFKKLWVTKREYEEDPYIVHRKFA